MKTLITLLLLSGSASMSFAADAITKPISLDCKGSTGELSLTADRDQKELQLTIHEGALTHLIHIDATHAEDLDAQPAVEILSDSTDEGQAFVDIDASFDKKQWVPASTSCEPTRSAHGPCLKITNPAHWAILSVKSLELVLEPAGNEQYTLASFGATDFGVSSEQPLGANAICTANF